MDSKFRKISPLTDSTVPISRMDMGLNNYDSPTTERQMYKDFEKTKNRKKKDLQKENNFCKNSSKIDWDALDTIPKGIPLSQTTFHNTSYLCQRQKMGYMDSMVPSNISRAPMVEQHNNGEQSSFNYERPSSASSNYNRCSPKAWEATLQIVKNDKFFNPEKEVKKLTLTEILQSIITEDGRVFCPTNINNSKLS
jgi:hypothetical protein